MDAQDKARERLIETYHDKDFNFVKKPRQPGNPIFIKTIQNRLRRLLKIAGLNEELHRIPYAIHTRHYLQKLE